MFDDIGKSWLGNFYYQNCFYQALRDKLTVGYRLSDVMERTKLLHIYFPFLFQKAIEEVTITDIVVKRDE